MANRWLILILLFTARVVIGFQFQSVGSSAAFLVADLSIDYARLGTLIGLYNLPGIVLAVPSGLLGRRFGDRRVVAAALALMALGGFVMGFSHTYTLAAAGRLLAGAGEIMLDVQLTKMVADWFAGREIVFAMAAFVSSFPVGISLGLLTLGPLAAATSWQVTMHLTGLASLVALVLVLTLYRAPGHIDDRPTPGWSGLNLSYREVGLVLLAGAIWMLFNIAFTSLVSFGPDYLISAGNTVAAAGRLVSVVTWVGLATLLLGGYFTERLNRPNLVMAAAFLAGGLAIWLVPFWDNPLVLFIAVGLFLPLAPGALLALPAEVLRPENRGPGMGVFYTLSYAGAAGLPALAGLTRDLTQNPAAPIMFGGSALLAALLFLGLFRAAQGGRPAKAV